jgi:orotate phosphoribosyltransferase
MTVASPGADVLLTTDQALAVFTDSGALLDGHFVLTSGRHAAQYFEKFHVLRSPRHVERLCADLAGRLAPFRADIIMGPTTLGVLLAYEVAKQLGVSAVYAEKSPDGQRMLRRPEHLPSGARVAIVDDILTTGGSLRECLDLCKRSNAVAVAAGVLVDRTAGAAAATLGVSIVATLSLMVESWASEEVPPWLAAIPVERPGSTGKK